MFSRPKILFLVSLLFVALLNPKFNPYLPFKFLIFYHSYTWEQRINGIIGQILIMLTCDETIYIYSSRTGGFLLYTFSSSIVIGMHPL